MSVINKIDKYLKEAAVPKEKESEFIGYLKHAGDPDGDFDAKELAMGIEVEKEHNDNPEVAKGISKAHLAEFPDYYTRLKKMEDEAKKAINEGSDEENPDYMFQMIHTKLLIMVANKKIDAVKMAKIELSQRGLGKSGSWVGFDKAKSEWGV